MTEPAVPDPLGPPPDPPDRSGPAGVDPGPGGGDHEPSSATADRRHAARLALAAVLLAPFVVLGAYAILVDRAEPPAGAAVAGAPGSTTTTVLGTGVTNMTPVAPWQTQFLACVRQTESGGDYTAVNPSGAGGAYQIMPTTWNNTAQHIGRPDLVGIAPQYATPSDQDLVAAGLLEWQGPGEWPDGCG